MLDARFMIAPALQQVFRDKDTGLPLSDGQVYFYEDKQRTVLKPVYELTGSPPNYTYTPLPNPVVLNSVGAFETAIYYFPFDNNDEIDLYFIEVWDSAGKPSGVLQLTREAYPNFIDESIVNSGSMVSSFVPNPQFLYHNDLREVPNDNNQMSGQIRAPSTQVAYGGWSFERPMGSTAIDFVRFTRFGSYAATPTNNPRYEVQVQSTSPDAGDTFKDLRLKFNNVNRFASLTQMYTYGFTGRSNSGSNLSVQLILIKNFGTGGSAEQEIPLTTFVLTPVYQNFNFSFVYGDNALFNLGTLDNDFIQLAIRFPVDILIDSSYTNFLLLEGAILSPQMPITTNSQMDYRSIAGFLGTPNYNNTSWYLPVRLTPDGLDFDTTQIGKIFITSGLVPELGELACNGDSFITQNIGPDGIPYSRLQAKWMVTAIFPGNNYPLFGTGENYVTQWRSFAVSEEAFLYANTGAQPINALPATSPFTITQIEPPLGQGLTAATTSPGNGLIVTDTVNGPAVASIGPGTSGFTVELLTSGEFNSFPGTPLTRLQYRIITTAAAPLAGLYFEYSNTGNAYYMWFRVDGVGVDPLVVGRTAVRLDLSSTDSSTDVANLVALRISNFDNYRITFTAAAPITGGNHWTFDTISSNFYVWYTKDGVGVDPNIIGRIGLKVDILSTDTASMINEKTQLVINAYQFQVPDLQGYFIRGLNSNAGSGIDADNELRINSGVPTDADFDLPGRIEWDANRQHNHTFESGNLAGGSALPQDGVFLVGQQLVTNEEGRFDSHPRNKSFLYIVKF